MMIKKHRINRLGFDYLVNMIKVKFNKSFISPGEMVGCIARTINW